MTCLDRMLKGYLYFVLCTVALIGMCVISAGAQKNLAKAQAADDVAQKKIKDASQQGIPLTNVTTTDVTSNISVEATLIPASVARTVFGKEIANNYAVISLTISNRSADQAFILHSIFIDYSQWLLSGGSPFEKGDILCLEDSKKGSGKQDKGGTSSERTDGAQTSAQPNSAATSGSSNCTGNRLQTWQQQTLPDQIASVESRIVREELLVQQPWTTRNWVFRSLQAAGSIATGFTFATSSQSWIRGIGAFNGSVIPAYQQLWPDSTVNQMNQISNVGFQVNKAIAKQSSDVVVAFFPIDRFLTPDLKSLFISSPAAFFSPIAALFDPKTHDKVEPYVSRVLGGDGNEQALFGNMVKFLPQLGSGTCDPFRTSTLALDGSLLTTTGTQDTLESHNSENRPLELACLTVAVVNRLSLNTIRLIVGGTMTVDVNSVPPQISSIDIETPSGETATSMWTVTSGKTKTLSGTIHGSFLGGATPSLVSAPAGVTIKAVTDGSSDTALNFTLTLSSNLPADTKQLTFQVSKSSASGSTIKSATHDLQIDQAPPTTTPQNGNGVNSAPIATPNAAPANEKPPTPPKK